jgi:hypothetical protein
MRSDIQLIQQCREQFGEVLHVLIHINIRLAHTERQFLSDGLYNRPFAFDTSYESQAFPGIVDSIASGRLDVARSEVLIAAAAIEQAALILAGQKDVLPF